MKQPIQQPKNPLNKTSPITRLGLSLLATALAAATFASLTLASQASTQTTAPAVAARNPLAFQSAPAGQQAPPLAPNDPAISYSFEPVITDGLSNPVFVTHAGDDRIFVVEQEGRIRTWQNGTLADTPFLSIEPVVRCCGEQGLLGLAFEPDFAATGRFYVYYTNNDGDENIARYTRSLTDTTIANSLSATILLTVPHPSEANHNGGWLGFGPDGFLYAATGDGGGGGDPFCSAQNANDLRGKLLRLDVVNQATYASPVTNTLPITITPRRPEVWALGLRNPWRNSFDRQTGDLYIGDVGQGAWEEVSVAPAGSSAGLNFGWSQREGRHDYDNNCTPSGIPQTEPFFDYGHDTNGGRSVTGGYVYRGPSYPWLNGVYFFGDFSSGRIWASTPQTAGVYNTVEITNTSYGIASFGEDAAGELYLINYGAGDIYRLSSTLESNGPTATPTSTATQTQTPGPTNTPGPMEPRAYLPVVMSFYVPPPTPTTTATPTDAPTATATATATSTTAAATETATPTPTGTDIAGTSTSTPTTTPTTQSSTETPTPTTTPTTQSSTETPTPTTTPTTQSSTETPTPTVTPTNPIPG